MASERHGPAADQIFYGLANVCFDKTEITEIQGVTGELRYRGYSIDELAAAPSYERVAYLLLYGDWPSAGQAAQFCADLARRRVLPAGAIELLRGLDAAAPAAALRTAVSWLGSLRAPPAPFDDAALDLIAQLPLLVTAHAALRAGRPVPPPNLGLDLASDFLQGLLGRPLAPLERRLINLDFVLHADHCANASTFAARVVASTEADIYAAFSGALAAFAGIRHGGAVEGVARMLDSIGTVEAVPGYVERQRRAGAAIMGFGHRVYRRADPRARHFRAAARELCAAKGDWRLFEILEALVEAMQPMARLGIAPNVDLYAALIYRLLGLSDDLSTAIFAAARSAGWAAQVLEQCRNNILIRPRMLYAGPGPRRLPA
jgi:citrate synthase